MYISYRSVVLLDQFLGAFLIVLCAEAGDIVDGFLWVGAIALGRTSCPIARGDFARIRFFLVVWSAFNLTAGHHLV